MLLIQVRQALQWEQPVYRKVEERTRPGEKGRK